MSKKDYMQLTPQQKQKYEEYLKSKGSVLPTKVASPSNLANNDQPEDILSFCLQDISTKLSNIAPNKEVKFKVESKKFQDNLALQFVDNILKVAQSENVRNKHNTLYWAIKVSDSLEEVIEKITMYCEVDIEFSMIVFKTIVVTYLDKCLLFNIKADPEMIKLLAL